MLRWELIKAVLNKHLREEEQRFVLSDSSRCTNYWQQADGTCTYDLVLTFFSGKADLKTYRTCKHNFPINCPPEFLKTVQPNDGAQQKNPSGPTAFCCQQEHGKDITGMHQLLTFVLGFAMYWEKSLKHDAHANGI